LIGEVESACIKENIRRSSETGQDCNFILSLDGDKAETSAETLTENFLKDLNHFAQLIGLAKDKKEMFDEFCARNKKTLSMRFVEDVKKSGGVLPMVIERSVHTKKKINNNNLSLFKKETELSKNEYLKEKNEDKMLFEDYLETFRGEIK
jgi:hypothetical protein